MSFPIPHNEEARIKALRDFDEYLQNHDAGLQAFAEIASSVCGAPISLVTMIDRTEQRLIVRCGIDGDKTSRDHAFCAHTIMKQEIMEVEDAQKDPRFSDNPFVTGDPRIRFYAGAPIIDKGGFALGSLCVIDTIPRKLNDDQRSALSLLAKSAMNHLELQRTSAQLAKALADLKTIGGLIPICAHCKGIRNDDGFWQSVEQFMSAHGDVRMSHGICPECLKKHYPGFKPSLS